MEEEPVEGVVVYFPFWMVGGMGGFEDCAGCVAGTDDVDEEVGEFLEELGPDEVAYAGAAICWLRSNVVVDEVESAGPAVWGRGFVFGGKELGADVGVGAGAGAKMVFVEVVAEAI
jgi:hypothetical protein